MLKRRQFPYNKRDIIISDLLQNTSYQGPLYGPVLYNDADVNYVIPKRRDIIVKGFYYANVSYYLTLQEINHYKGRTMMFHFECVKASGGVYADRFYIEFDKKNGLYV
jgi:hypothetical protein